MSLTPRLPLSRSAINRDAASREIPGLLDTLWGKETTKVVVIWRGEALIDEGERPSLRYVSPAECPSWRHRIYLGLTTSEAPGVPRGTPVVAAVVDDAIGHALEPDVAKWMSARTLAHRFDDLDAGVVVQALAMANWHDAHQFSPLTGAAAESSDAGWVRVDQGTGKNLFPRTDAAVIVLVTDSADRIVLGSNALWEPNRYSLLAGFVEPGESLEAAVVREVFEESGLTVKDPVYVGSQPWPFPASLMVGFTAVLDESHPRELRPDGQEIVDLRWFSRDELMGSLDSIMLPGRTSIARAMIEHWLGQRIPDGA